MSLTTIKSQQLTVTISSTGAEMHDVKGANGVDYLWNGDPAFWSSHAPILFPVAGGLKDDFYELDGVRYPLGKHGFVRTAPFTLEKATENSATFLYQEKDEGFPFEYDFRATYTVDGNQVKVDYSVSSRDDRPFYFSVGAHEAYATPEGIEAYTVHFDETETLAHAMLDGSQNTHETQLIKENTKELALKQEYFAVDALVFRTLKSRGVTLVGGGRKIRVDFPDHPYLLLWTKPNAPYICIEPWCNGPDFVDADPRIDHKPGFMRLEKGQTITRTHVITFG